MDNRRFIPTDIGKIVNRFLTEQLPALRRVRLHRRDGGRARRHLARRRGLGAAAGEVLEAVQRAGRRHREERHARGSRAGARARHRSGVRQAGERAHGPLSARSCRSAPRTTRRSRSSRACARARRWTRSRCRMRSSCSSCRASSGETRRRRADQGRDRPLRALREVRRRSTSRSRTTIRTRSSCERALELIREEASVDANRIIQDFPEAGIQVLNGRYGPYITDGKRNARSRRIATRSP